MARTSVPPALPSDSTPHAGDRPAWEASIPERLRETARRHGGRLAVRASGKSLTYAELDRCSDGIARALIDAIRERLRLDLPASELLAARTVAEMAVVVTAALAGLLRDGMRDQLLGRLDAG